MQGKKFKYYLSTKKINHTGNIAVYIHVFFALIPPKSEALASASTAFNLRGRSSFCARGRVVHKALLDSYGNIETNSNALTGTRAAATKIGTSQRGRQFISLHICTALRIYLLIYYLFFYLSTTFQFLHTYQLPCYFCLIIQYDLFFYRN